MPEFDRLLDLTLSDVERDWLLRRLETLSAKETVSLAALLSRDNPQTAKDAINEILALPDCTVYPASNYEALGRLYLEQGNITLPDTVAEFTNMSVLGVIFEGEHPGLFIGGCYAAYPQNGPHELYDGTNLDALDAGKLVHVKLGSEHHPEGVWIHLPDYAEAEEGPPDEVGIALHVLGVESPEQCTILDFQCPFREIKDVRVQYENAGEFLYDANNLGFLVEEHGHGTGNFMQRFAAALQYENCVTLRDAVNIGDHIEDYDVIHEEEIEAFARRELEQSAVPREVYHAVDLDGYGRRVLEEQGYFSDRSGALYVKRIQEPGERFAPSKKKSDKKPDKKKKKRSGQAR